MNLKTAINNSPYYFYFLVVDEFLDINLPQLKNFEKIYLSDYPSVKIKNSGKLLSSPQVVDYITKKAQKNKLTPAIIPFKPSAKIDVLCQKNNWVNVSNPSPINRFLEDKVKFAKLCYKYNLPTLPFSISTFSEKNFIKYQHLYGQELVIQTHFGWAGNSTFSSSSWEKIKNKISLGIVVKYSPFIPFSYSLLNNCCFTKFGLIQSPPALQYTGVTAFTNNPFTTVGRQWPSFAPPKIIRKVKSTTKDFGKILKKIGYKGFFGLDFLVSNDKVFLLECNPRLTSSFAFYTKLEQEQKITPLFYFHLAEFLKLNYQINFKFETKRFCNKNIIGSELTPKNKENHTHKKLNFSYPLSKSTDITSIPKELNEKS